MKINTETEFSFNAWSRLYYAQYPWHHSTWWKTKQNTNISWLGARVRVLWAFGWTNERKHNMVAPSNRKHVSLPVKLPVIASFISVDKRCCCWCWQVRRRNEEDDDDNDKADEAHAGSAKMPRLHSTKCVPFRYRRYGRTITDRQSTECGQQYERKKARKDQNVLKCGSHWKKRKW